MLKVFNVNSNLKNITRNVGTARTLSMNNSAPHALVKQLVSKKLSIGTPQVSMTPESSSEFLLKYPRGAYTTARSVQKSYVLEYEFHVNRMVKSSEEIFNEKFGYDLMNKLMLSSLNTGMKYFMNNFPDHHEMKLSLLFTHSESEESYLLLTHICDLPKPHSYANVEIRTAHRDNPTVKDSEWVKSRMKLEKEKAGDVNEIVMQDNQGFLYEGTQTNFYAVERGKDNELGCIVTAPDSQVLPGTIRNIIIEICNEFKIPFRLELPKISEMDKWSGAFISSTSRIILPIKTMRFPEKNAKDHEFEGCDTIRRLKELTESELLRKSSLVLDGS